MSDLLNKSDSATPEASLRDLLARIGAQDQAAMSEFYSQTVSQVFAIARAFLCRKEDAEELVCDVYVFVWKRHADYNPVWGSVQGWLAMQTRSRAIDLLRLGRSVHHVDDRRAQSADSLPDPTTAPEQYWIVFEPNSEMRRALEKLSPLRQRLIALAFFEDLSHASIAKAIDMPLGAVKRHLRRTLSILRRSISKSA